MESEKQSYEDRAKAFYKKVFSAQSWSEVTCVYMLLNLNPEEASITEFHGLEKPTPTEQQLKPKTQPSTPTQQQDSI